jgi:hypothetical protein
MTKKSSEQICDSTWFIVTAVIIDQKEKACFRKGREIERGNGGGGGAR